MKPLYWYLCCFSGHVCQALPWAQTRLTWKGGPGRKGVLVIEQKSLSAPWDFRDITILFFHGNLQSWNACCYQLYEDLKMPTTTVVVLFCLCWLVFRFYPFSMSLVCARDLGSTEWYTSTCPGQVFLSPAHTFSRKETETKENSQVLCWDGQKGNFLLLLVWKLKIPWSIQWKACGLWFMETVQIVGDWQWRDVPNLALASCAWFTKVKMTGCGRELCGLFLNQKSCNSVCVRVLGHPRKYEIVFWGQVIWCDAAKRSI